MEEVGRRRLTRTNRQGVILDEEVWLIRSGDSYKILGSNYEIPTSKVYHPMQEYWDSPTLANLVRCNLRMLLYKSRMKKLAILKGTHVSWDRYGVYFTSKFDRQEYYLQFREKDYLKLKRM